MACVIVCSSCLRPAVCRVKRLRIRPFLFLFFSLFFFVLEGKIFITQVQQYEPPENVTSTANLKVQANITLCMAQPYGPMHVTSLHAGRHGDRSSSTALVWGKHPLWTDRLLALWLGRCSYALCDTFRFSSAPLTASARRGWTSPLRSRKKMKHLTPDLKGCKCLKCGSAV